MIIDMNYWTKVFRKILIFVFSIIGLYLAFKLSIFYIPFLVALIISFFIEPLIRFLMKYLKLKRKISAIIVFIFVLLVLSGIIYWGIFSLITESINLLNNLNTYIEKITNIFNNIIMRIDITRFKIPNEIMETIKSSSYDLLDELANWIKNILNNILGIITSLPKIGIYTVICVLSLYFICTDKIYMIDQLEHHFPELWVKKLTKHVKNITRTLAGYLKAQMILVVVSFFVCLIGLYIYKFAGLNIEFPLIVALGIAFVDALPIFGSASVMIPWAIISSLNGDVKLGFCIIVLLTIMTISRQIIEPKLVSNQIGIHPIFTLIAMYTGFKLVGIIGLFIGPIALIIIKNIFSTMIDKGVAKSIFDREI